MNHVFNFVLILYTLPSRTTTIKVLISPQALLTVDNWMEYKSHIFILYLILYTLPSRTATIKNDLHEIPYLQSACVMYKWHKLFIGNLLA